MTVFLAKRRIYTWPGELLTVSTSDSDLADDAHIDV